MRDRYIVLGFFLFKCTRIRYISIARKYFLKAYRINVRINNHYRSSLEIFIHILPWMKNYLFWQSIEKREREKEERDEKSLWFLLLTTTQAVMKVDSAPRFLFSVLRSLWIPIRDKIICFSFFVNFCVTAFRGGRFRSHFMYYFSERCAFLICFIKNTQQLLFILACAIC